MSDERFAAILEITILGIVAIISGFMAGYSIRMHDAGGSAVWSALLMAIINTIKERRSSRSIDRMGAQLGQSIPATDAKPEDAPTGKPDDPISVTDTKDAPK